MLLIITSTGDRLFRFINIDDLEPSKKEFFVIFLRFLATTHISRVNCAEMARDGPGQHAYDIFSIEHTFLRI